LRPAGTTATSGSVRQLTQPSSSAQDTQCGLSRFAQGPLRPVHRSLGLNLSYLAGFYRTRAINRAVSTNDGHPGLNRSTRNRLLGRAGGRQFGCDRSDYSWKTPQCLPNDRADCVRSVSRINPTGCRTLRYAPDPRRFAHHHRHSRLPWPSKPLSLRPATLQAGLDPFRDSGTFELRDRAQDVYLKFSRRCGGIDAFSE